MQSTSVCGTGNTKYVTFFSKGPKVMQHIVGETEDATCSGHLDYVPTQGL